MPNPSNLNQFSKTVGTSSAPETRFINPLTGNIGSTQSCLTAGEKAVPGTVKFTQSFDSVSSDKKFTTTTQLKVEKDFDNSDWDKLLRKYYNKHILSYDLAKTAFPDAKFFKAQMLHESNGDPKIKGGSVGLFQLTNNCFIDMLGQASPEIREEYRDPEKNIDLALGYIVKLVKYIQNYLKQIGIDPRTGISPEDYRYLVTISFNQGPSVTGKGIKAIKLSNPTMTKITYKDVETLGIVRGLFTQVALNYVPIIQQILSKIAMLA